MTSTYQHLISLSYELLHNLKSTLMASGEFSFYNNSIMLNKLQEAEQARNPGNLCGWVALA